MATNDYESSRRPQAPASAEAVRVPPHNDEAERSVLGCVFIENQSLDELGSRLTPEAFYRENHRHIFRAMLEMHQREEVIDVITLTDHLAAKNLIDAVGGPTFLSRLSSAVPSVANAQQYATIVRRKASLREFITTAHALIDECYGDVSDFESFMDKAESQLFAITQQGTKRSYQSIREVISEAFAQIESLYKKAEKVTGVASGFIDLDEITAGWQPSDLVIIAARPAMGKCLSASSEVLLSDGRVRTMAQLYEARDARVAALSQRAMRFEAARVSDFIDDGLKPIFEVVTRSGRKIEVTAPHPMLTLSGWRPLIELQVGEPIGVPRELPFFGAQPAPEAHVKLCAYLLGDGTLTGNTPRFTQQDPEIVADFQAAVAEFGGVNGEPLKTWLESIKLWGCTAGEKHIPDFVFQLPREQVALFLNRLFSTDGWASELATGQVQVGYCSVSERLVRQVAHLLLRFGIMVQVRQRETSGQRAWVLNLTHGPSLRLFAQEIGIISKDDALQALLAREPADSPNHDVIPAAIYDSIATLKGDESWASLARRAGLEEGQLRPRDRGITRERLEQVARALKSQELLAIARSQLLWDPIVAITPLGRRQVYDLTVPEHHNFVAQDICVHNTALTLNMACHAALERRVPVAFFSLEMANVQLVIRLLCSEARIDQGKLRTGRMSEAEWARLIQAAASLSEAPIFLDDTPALPIMEFRSKVRQLKAEHDIGIIFIDYLQLMKAPGRNIGSREQEISEISRNLKAIAKELSVPVLALAQLNRGVEQRADKRPMNSDLRECVTGDTLVQLADGRRLPIASLVGQTPEVIALAEDGNLIRAASDAVWKVGQREVFTVRFRSGRTIRATGKHRLKTLDGWARVRELAVGDRLALARTIPEPALVEVWQDELVALLGQMIGDGSYLSGQPMRYTSSSEENLAVVKAGARALGCETRRYDRDSWSQLVISGNGNRWHPAGVNKWLRELGIFNQRSHEKRIPTAAFRLGSAQIGLLLRHMWAADGSVHVRKGRGSHRIFYATNSAGLASDVCALLLRLGIVATIRQVDEGAHRDGFTVDVSGREAQLMFLERVGWHGPRQEAAEALYALHTSATTAANTNTDTIPQEVFESVKALMRQRGISHREMAQLRGTSYGGSAHFSFAPSREVLLSYATILEDKPLHQLATSALFWDQVVAVEPAGVEDVYDLTVPGPASWLANDGIVSHNSGAIEQDADIISFIYRDEVYNPESDQKGIAEVILGKHRNGSLGTVMLRFFGEFTRFENLAPDME